MSEKVPHLHITIVRYDQRSLIESVTGIDEMGETRTLPRLQLHSRLKYEPGSVTCEGHVEGNHHLVIFQGGFIIRVIDADDRPIRDQLGHLPGSKGRTLFSPPSPGPSLSAAHASSPAATPSPPGQ